MKIGNAVKGVICADRHLGYAQPVGGVIAYEKQLSISGVGFDIGCGNMAVQLDTREQDLVHDAIEALKHTWQNQVRFHFAGDELGIEHSPQMPAHLLERLRKASKGIAMILLSPLRPAGYSNEAWLEAVLDADRLGYAYRCTK